MMPRPRLWKSITARSLDREVYGRIALAMRHVSGALLLHRKFVSRNSPHYRRCGQWLVVMDRTVIRSKPYNAKPVTVPPTRWANQVLRYEADGTYARERAEQQQQQAEWQAARRAALNQRAGDVDPILAAALRRATSTPEPPADLVPPADDVDLQVDEAKGDQLRWRPTQFDELPRSLNPMGKPFTERALRRGWAAQARAKKLRAIARGTKARPTAPAHEKVRDLLPR